MKKFLLLILVAMTAFGVNAQTRKGEGSLMGSLGYQPNYERFGLQAQGLDVNVNFHYGFNFSKDGQGFSVYPLAGIGMQNNFYGKQDVEVNGVTTQVDRSNSTKFAFNLGGGITLPLSERSFLNAEAKFMFAEDDNVVIMLGYGYKF